MTLDEPTQPGEASAATRAAHARLRASLPFADEQSLADAQRGQLAPASPEVIRTADGRLVWDPARFAFVAPGAEAPDTVNPSLWRQSQLVNLAGLFQVAERIYQVRNYDLSNMTIVEGRQGLIVIDPLISVETARAALALYCEHRPRKPVTAVIYSHSHVDHFGGVRGVVDEGDVAAGKVPIYAPEGFLAHAISENVLAGNVMSRRASYMYGNLLPPGPRGQVGSGLGTTTSSGTISLIPPTVEITTDDHEETIDGLRFQFLLAPGSEAPAEMHWFLPELKALTAAENACHVLHNTYSLRGTRIRDPLAWSKYLNETLRRWGSQAEVLYGMHHWPVWGTQRVVGHLKQQRDLYRFINDQTLRLANRGYSMTEIAEMLELPEPLARYWANRGYYGTLNHNVKATYVFYLGWFDGNPATLHPLPRIEAARRYVDYMGGAAAVLARAREAYEQGEYRWVAEVVNHVIFAEPDDRSARLLQAQALEQLGYQAESGPWRNFYLSGAQELRDGVRRGDAAPTASPELASKIELDQFFDYLAMRLDADKAAGRKITINFDFTDLERQFVVALENSVLNHTEGQRDPEADATLTLRRSVLDKIIRRELTMPAAAASGAVRIEGNPASLVQLFSLLDTFDPYFALVTPRESAAR